MRSGLPATLMLALAATPAYAQQAGEATPGEPAGTEASTVDEAAEDQSGEVEVGQEDEAAPEGETGPPIEDAGAGAQGAVAGEEITVVGELELRRRRAEVDKTLRVLQYREGKRKEDKTVYRPERPWKPSVEVYDEGYVIIKRSPVRFEPPTAKKRPIDYFWCIPPFTPVCFRVGGQMVSDAKLQPQKGQVAQAIDPPLRHWREAIVSNAWSERVGEEIPDQLEGVWTRGEPFEGDELLATPGERRVAILDFWAGRACTPEGEEVRQLVALFLEYEVQDSDHPLTQAEVDAAHSKAHCDDQLPSSLVSSVGQ